MMNTAYELVVGLEIHVELKTATKIFCGCSTAFGSAPNTQCCPVCLGYPGALPVLNRKVVDYAIKAGLATNCQIAHRCKMDRKNYVYPDLPKAYQISQHDKPLCRGGYIDIETANGSKRIGITRIHMEEDAGKLMHDKQKGTLIDNNRCGVPLIEIVSEPQISTPDEAVAYMKKLRTVMLYIGVSDCKMQEGSMRCDVNLSVRPAGSTALGTRTEIKNINSFSFVSKAIAHEYQRQLRVIEEGGTILQETRRFDPTTGQTHAMRSKESAEDYRFFPDPDLVPIITSNEDIEALRREIPQLPDARKARYTKDYGLSSYDGEQITADRRLADYFDDVARLTAHPKTAANLLMTEALALPLAEKAPIPVATVHFAALADLLGSGTVNSNTAKKLLCELWEKDQDPRILVEQRGLMQINDRKKIKALLLAAIAKNPRGIDDYRRGKTHAVRAYIGAVMAATGGLSNPAVINEVLMEVVQDEQ